nr:MAG TPA: hypothetical protein [Inoviridae sp.]
MPNNNICSIYAYLQIMLNYCIILKTGEQICIMQLYLLKLIKRLQ